MSKVDQTFTVDSLEVRVFASQAELAQAAAGEARAVLREAIARSGGAAAIFAAANSQIQTLAALVALGNVD